MIFEEIGSSIFKPAAYAGFARQKAGRAVLYLVLIALPLAITGAARLGTGWNLVMDLGAKALADAPDFRLDGGVLEFDAPQPYYLYADGMEVGVVDTTGTVDRSVLEGKDRYFLIQGDRMVVKNGARTDEAIYAQTGLTDLDRADVVSMLRTMKSFGFLLGVIWTASSVGAKMFAALLLTLATWVAAISRGKAATFGVSWSIAVHAMTLSLILGFARSLFMVTIHYFGLIYWGAALVYATVATGFLPPLVAAPEQGGESPPTASS